MRAFLIFSILITVSACDSTPEPVDESVATTPFVVRCDNPIPEFTLGQSSNPTADQITQLCSCVWENLGSWERDVARAASEGREKDISDLHLRAFPSRFGDAIRMCDGMKL